jgi:hypothetical protein
MVTEQGWVGVVADWITLIGRDSFQDLLPPQISFDRTALLPYRFGYSDIKRIALGQNYLNTCTVNPPVAASQNAKKNSGIATYGTYGAEFSTVDDSSPQALSFAQWQVQSRNDPDELSFQISVSDTANDLSVFFDAMWGLIPIVTVLYKNPGSNTTMTSAQIIQGFSMSVTPSRTDVEVFTSPLTYTNYFTLNSATLGVLNTSRLGW